jgi:predicted deacetylase
MSALPDGACVRRMLYVSEWRRNKRWADRRTISQVAVLYVPSSGSLWDMSL